ncbi:uncharacterized protein LOC128680424 isoform X2 [Plodia interpunctella]|uniref:uncharacterized protein LOC128680424 isoform X2 n=1 Tax=Plodia interpunctella TaxID=58824 RepID=UPI002368CE96|nr:uncharacterized protein LOC128680424 isoform X2 [Plodia interpunctella]
MYPPGISFDCACLPPRATAFLVAVISLGGCIADGSFVLYRRPLDPGLGEMVQEARQYLIKLFQVANVLLLIGTVIEKEFLVQLYLWYTLGFVMFGLVIALMEFLISSQEYGTKKSLVMFIPDVTFLFVIWACLPIVKEYKGKIVVGPKGISRPRPMGISLKKLGKINWKKSNLLQKFFESNPRKTELPLKNAECSPQSCKTCPPRSPKPPPKSTEILPKLSQILSKPCHSQTSPQNTQISSKPCQSQTSPKLSQILSKPCQSQTSPQNSQISSKSCQSQISPKQSHISKEVCKISPKNSGMSSKNLRCCQKDSPCSPTCSRYCPQRQNEPKPSGIKFSIRAN